VLPCRAATVGLRFVVFVGWIVLNICHTMGHCGVVSPVLGLVTPLVATWCSIVVRISLSTKASVASPLRNANLIGTLGNDW